MASENSSDTGEASPSLEAGDATNTTELIVENLVGNRMGTIKPRAVIQGGGGLNIEADVGVVAVKTAGADSFVVESDGTFGRRDSKATLLLGQSLVGDEVTGEGLVLKNQQQIRLDAPNVKAMASINARKAIFSEDALIGGALQANGNVSIAGGLNVQGPTKLTSVTVSQDAMVGEKLKANSVNVNNLEVDTAATVGVLQIKGQGIAGAMRKRDGRGLSILADTVGFQTAVGAETFVLDVTAGEFGCINGPVTLRLWGSQISDTGGGRLKISSVSNMELNAEYVRVGTLSAELPGSGSNAIQLDVAKRMRVRQGGTWSAGIWFRQDTATNDFGEAFVGMSDDTHVGFWGTAAGLFGLVMDVTNGTVTIAKSLDVTGTLSAHHAYVNGTVVIGVPPGPFTQFARRGLTVHGPTNLNGTVSKPLGRFRIDHPLAPATRYLSHSFVESPDMLNIYSGDVTTDAGGEAVVDLPAYFEALNRDFRYQLTVIGQFAQAIVARKIERGRFVIKTDRPHTSVSWQVTGIRQDPYAKAYPIVVEEKKQQHELGFFLHPELYGQPESRNVVYAAPEGQQSSVEVKYDTQSDFEPCLGPRRSKGP